MIRITTTKRLAALHAEAAQLPELRAQVTAVQERLAAAETARDGATAELRECQRRLEPPAPAPEAAREEPVPPASAQPLPTVDDLHHPHFISATPTAYGTKYRFNPFTGREPKPTLPYEKVSHLAWDDLQPLYSEYDAARIMWGQAKFRCQARPALTNAVPAWQGYVRARSAMDAAFAAFWDTEDGNWRAQILRLSDAQSQALTEARRWDEVAEGLARLERDHLDEVGEMYELRLRHFASELDLDIKDWDLDHYSAYERPRYHYGSWSTPLVKEVEKEVDRQKERLKEVADLSGQPAADVTDGAV